MAYGIIAGVEKTTIYLEGDLRRRLQVFARRASRPQAEVIRDAIREYLLRHAQPTIPSWVGSVTDAPPTDSSTIKQEMRPLWGEHLERKYGGRDRDHP
jgi:metal-responsive CopG/Arc/MetJ family transcriptional regulator